MAIERTASCPECSAERQTRANPGVFLSCSNGHKYRAPDLEPPPAEPAASNGGVPVKRATAVKIRQVAKPKLQDSSGGVADKSRPGPAGPKAGPAAPAVDPVPPAAGGDPAGDDPLPPPASSQDPVDPPAGDPPADPGGNGQRNGRKGGLGRYRELVGGRQS